MLDATRGLVLPTTITGSYPRPQWFTEELRGRGFKDALGDSRFREQYLDAVLEYIPRLLTLDYVRLNISARRPSGASA